MAPDAYHAEARQTSKVRGCLLLMCAISRNRIHTLLAAFSDGKQNSSDGREVAAINLATEGVSVNASYRDIK